MAKFLDKPIKRQVLIGGRTWIVSLLPDDAIHRYPRIDFREKHTRKTVYSAPLETVRNDAAERYARLLAEDRRRARKAKMNLAEYRRLKGHA